MYTPQVFGLRVEPGGLDEQAERANERLDLGLRTTLAVVRLDEVEQQLLRVQSRLVAVEAVAAGLSVTD